MLVNRKRTSNTVSYTNMKIFIKTAVPRQAFRVWMFLQPVCNILSAIKSNQHNTTFIPSASPLSLKYPSIGRHHPQALSRRRNFNGGRWYDEEYPSVCRPGSCVEAIDLLLDHTREWLSGKSIASTKVKNEDWCNGSNPKSVESLVIRGRHRTTNLVSARRPDNAICACQTHALHFR